MNDFKPIACATPVEQEYVCPKGFWLKSPICRACSNYEVSHNKVYCLCGYK